MADAVGMRWRAWLRAQLDERGWEQRDLLEHAGGAVKGSILSKWLKGEIAPSADSAVVVAEVLGADPAVALLVSGHGRLAQLVDPSLDPVVAEIRASGLSQGERVAREARYRRAIEAVAELTRAGLPGSR